jgi:D-arginine dehydrogenase
VDAAGAWADELAVLAGGRPVGLTPKRRTAAIVAPPPEVDVRHWPMVIGAAEDVYFRPEVGKLLLSPADATPVPPCDVQPEEWDVALAVHRLEELLEIDVARVEHRWAGLRTFAADGSPVVGWDPQLEEFFWLAGQGGYGIQMAPALARLAAALVSGKALPADLMEFDQNTVDPRRFLDIDAAGAS